MGNTGRFPMTLVLFAINNIEFNTNANKLKNTAETMSVVRMDNFIHPYNTFITLNVFSYTAISVNFITERNYSTQINDINIISKKQRFNFFVNLSIFFIELLVLDNKIVGMNIRTLSSNC